jgi:hypothetical protein
MTAKSPSRAGPQFRRIRLGNAGQRSRPDWLPRRPLRAGQTPVHVQSVPIAEIVAHLADAELVGGYRIRAILGAPGCQVIGFDQEVWVTALHYDKRNLGKSFAQYGALREANLALVKTLTPEQWKHYGVHNERGAETIETIVRMFAGHDLNHFQQIERIVAAKK